MKIEADARIPFPRKLVFETYRDKLVELVPYLPNVREIAVKERQDAVGGVEGVSTFLNVWKAKADIPKIAQKVIKPDMLEWLDHAKWNQNDWCCDWRTETKMFTENVKCEGHNTYVEDGDVTILQIRGVLDVKLQGVPGVPRFLAAKVAPHIESFIVNLLKPNLLSVADGLQRYLEENAS